jgi:DNA primase
MNALAYVEQSIGVVGARGRKIACPLHEDPKPSLHVWGDHFHCFECGAHGDMIALLAIMENGRPFDPKRDFRAVMEKYRLERPTPVSRRRDVQRAPYRWRTFDEVQHYQDNARDREMFKEYLRGRGIHRPTAEWFRLGLDAEWLVIPVIWGGRVFSIKRRNMVNNSPMPKYLATPHSAPAIFNGDVLNDSETVYIVEGELDCISMTQMGYPCVSLSAGAASFRPQWGELFSSKEVVITFDTDFAGYDAAIDIKDRFIPHARVAHVPRPFKDANEWLTHGGEGVIEDYE